MLKMVLRSLALLVALVFVAAVSGAYADQIGSRFHEDQNLIKVEPSVNFHAYLHQLPVAETNSTYGEDHESWRVTGLRDGRWLRLSLRDGWETDINEGGNNGDPSTPSAVATPEPGTLLLLAAGLFIVRRRVLNT